MIPTATMLIMYSRLGDSYHPSITQWPEYHTMHRRIWGGGGGGAPPYFCVLGGMLSSSGFSDDKGSPSGFIFIITFPKISFVGYNYDIEHN